MMAQMQNMFGGVFQSRAGREADAQEKAALVAFMRQL
jgi:hypothetical protein